MSQSTIDYINAQIVQRDYTATGDVIIKSKLIFNNGYVSTGEAIRDINGFDINEAQKAADNNAISKLENGVEFILTKSI